MRIQLIVHRYSKFIIFINSTLLYRIFHVDCQQRYILNDYILNQVFKAAKNIFGKYIYSKLKL
jgi:hypothetical protein